jgi:hypothetical protein
MEPILASIQQVTKELHEIRAHLGECTSATTNGETLLHDAASLDVLSGFKNAVDELRRFLWFYIDELAKRKNEESDMLMYTYRVRRAAEILRSLQEDSARFAAVPSISNATFLEQITSVVEGYVATPKPEGAEG